MLIFYRGQPPFPAQSCAEKELLTMLIGVIIPAAILGLTLLVSLHKAPAKKLGKVGKARQLITK